jgi:hypothetical protein
MVWVPGLFRIWKIGTASGVRDLANGRSSNLILHIMMKEMKPYYFEHPQYGKMRVMMVGGKIFFNMSDLHRIFDKTPKELFEIVADTEGELRNFHIVMEPKKVEDFRTFFLDMEMMTSNRRKRNVAVDYNFCDEVMVADMVNPQKRGDKLIAKWLLGFIKNSLNNKMFVYCYCADGVFLLSDNSEVMPADVRFNGRVLTRFLINNISF